MPTCLQESRLRFSFGDAWRPLIQFDQSAHYSRVLRSLPGTRGVDFVGLHGSRVYLIEVKNFRRFFMENRERLTSGALFDEVATKARDTVAALLGAHLTEAGDEDWGALVMALRSRTTSRSPLVIVLWLEGVSDARARRREPVRRQNYQDALKKRLGWLSSRVLVQAESADEGRLVPDLDVRSMPDHQP